MRAKYFEDELAYLRESGKLFAKQNPKLIKYLSERSTDPDVERLLEGFAFLTSKIREKLDDEFPELTHSLLTLLAPNYLRPFPATTLMKLTPVDRAITERQIVKAGTEINSRPSSDDIICPFRITSDVDIYPLEIDGHELERTSENTALTVHFRTMSGLTLDRFDIGTIRLWFTGDQTNSQMLYLWFRKFLKSVTIIPHHEAANSASGRAEKPTEGGAPSRKPIAGDHIDKDATAVPFPIDHILPGGLGEHEAIQPTEGRNYEGYRLLQEYFVFPDKFLCVDLAKIGERLNFSDSSGFAIKFSFKKALPPEVKVRPDTLQLYCVPALNIFRQDAEPKRVDHRRLHYPLRPATNQTKSKQIFSVDRVFSWGEINEDDDIDLDWREEADDLPERVRVYPQFETFRHEVERANGLSQIYYRLRTESGTNGLTIDHLLSFVRHDNSRVSPEHEILSAELTCFNPKHAHQIAAGDICIPTENTPSFVDFRNLTQPIPPVDPPMDGRLLWALISNMALNYRSLLDPEVIAAIVAIYDFRSLTDRQSERAAQRRIDGLKSIHTEPIDRLFRGLPTRGLRSTMRVSEQAFQSEGDLYLFCSLLAEFFSLYASINSFHEFIAISDERNEDYKWPAKIGRQPLI